jgi:predicted amidohydrolase
MRVAAIQTTAGPDRGSNLEAAGHLVAEAARAGAELVVLPEYFSVAGTPDVLRRDAESQSGPTVTWASDLARRWAIHLVAGSFPEREEASAGRAPALFNTSCLVGPTGAVVAAYRKVHLFDVVLDGTSLCESATISPGDTLQVAPLGRGAGAGGPGPVLGMSICYDLRFPEPYRIMTLRGATVMAVPAAFTATTGPPHWELLLRARAVENQVFVIAAGQVGDLPPGMPRGHGHSMIVDPWGVILAERTEPTPGVVMADLDPERQRSIRAELPVLANRRPAAYRWPDDSRRDDSQRDAPGRP